MVERRFEREEGFTDIDGERIEVSGWRLEMTKEPVAVFDPRHYYAMGSALHFSLDEAERLGHKLLRIASVGRALP